MPILSTEFTGLGIIHLSDIHFSTEADFITSKFDSFYNALKDDFEDCNHIVVIISGDIAKTGSTAEYSKASEFFAKLSGKLGERYKSSKVKFIFVPGNHDCDFSQDSQLRQNSIQNIDYGTLGKDSSVLDTCVSIQANFWNFFGSYEEPPKNKVYYKIIEEINDRKICFHCFNTAWMSQIHEAPGSLFFPVKKIPELSHANDFDLDISVFHHPTSWLNPNTKENNRKEFQNILDTISSLQVVGHEHENEIRRTENLDSPRSETLCATGEIFQDLEHPELSGFQTFVINLQQNTFKLNRYHWEKDLYKLSSGKTLSFPNKSKRPLELQEGFIRKLNRLNLPLLFKDKEAKLSDFYVYPDLEDMDPRPSDKIYDYFDSERLLRVDREGTYVLEGESQVGKSSLLNILTLELYEKGFYPILLDGSKIPNDNLEKSVNQAFKVQYLDSDDNYDRFRQLAKQKKVLLIDDVHACRLSKDTLRKFIENLAGTFGFVFLTIDTAHGLLPQCQSSFKNFNYYSIKPLGYAKRNLLVERYIKYRYSYATDDEDFFDKVRETFDKLCHVLGDKLIPPYPVFVITIIQSLDYTSLNTNETSYGYCYQTLIHLAFRNAGVSNDHIDSYINFITELSFEIFTGGSNSISESDLESFYDQYRLRFWAPRFDIVKKKLLESKIFKDEYGEYQFGYIYILYFLAAKKIAEMIDKEEGKRIVSSLFENLHVERNANILVFITHHTKNDAFIQDSLLTAMIPFDGISPITLEKTCHYYKLIQEVVQEIKREVIELRDPTKERRERLLAKDKLERQTRGEDLNNDDIENDIHLRPFLQAFKAIEIVGQIVKNRKGSLEISILKDMIVELYYTGFRMISFLGRLIKQEKDDLAQSIEEKVTERNSNYDIEKMVYRFLQFVSLQACLGIFSQLILHVGVKDLHDLFNNVANEINTPAAHLVSFSINSYYGKINIKELERLSKEFEHNPVAFQILRSRIKAYLYNNYVDYRLKQKIGAYLKMEVPAMIGQKNRGF